MTAILLALAVAAGIVALIYARPKLHVPEVGEVWVMRRPKHVPREQIKKAQLIAPAEVYIAGVAAGLVTFRLKPGVEMSMPVRTFVSLYEPAAIVHH